MREDMSRVIVERPRIIDSIERKGRCRSLEDLPKQQGMRRSQRERGGYKMLNENLAPLRRFLERPEIEGICVEGIPPQLFRPALRRQ